MTVTTRAEVKVGTADLRDALRATLPLASKVITGDDEAEHRVRLILDAGWILVCASNGAATGLARVRIKEDSRGALGVLEADDGPLVVDLRPRRVKIFLQAFKNKPTDPDTDQLIEIEVDLDNKFVRFEDIGGLWSSGEAIEWPIEEASEAFPNIVHLTSRALNGIGASQVGKALVTDSTLLAHFKAAGDVYDQPLQIEATGTPDSRGFVISCGAAFLGTITSKHQDDDSLKNRDKWRNGWRDLLPKPAKTLAAV